MSAIPSTHVLDNPIWHALKTGNSRHAYGNDVALGIKRDMGAFAGMPVYDEASFAHMNALVDAGDIVVLFTARRIALPQGWRATLERELLQMEHRGAVTGTAVHPLIQPLGEAHIPAMLALTALTKPGPFLQRTIDFGNYEGVFENGRLVSMAGQRLQPGPYTEVSAVCTHPDALGKGYAGMLLQSQVQQIRAANRIPFLHVYPDNKSAVGLYRKLGFEVRRELMVYVLEKETGNTSAVVAQAAG